MAKGFPKIAYILGHEDVCIKSSIVASCPGDFVESAAYIWMIERPPKDYYVSIRPVGCNLCKLLSVVDFQISVLFCIRLHCCVGEASEAP